MCMEGSTKRWAQWMEKERISVDGSVAFNNVQDKH